jgi:hypothetical protein
VYSGLYADIEKVQSLMEACVEGIPVRVEKRQASRYQAYTKEQAAEWSSIKCPIMWKGNPSAIKTELLQLEVDTNFGGYIIYARD